MKYKIITLIVLLSALLLANIKPSVQYKAPDLNSVFPKKIGQWESRDVEAAEAVYSMLDRDELLLRLYNNVKENNKLSLAIVVTDKRDHIHDPEICYRGQGIFMKSEENIVMGEDLKLRLVNGEKREKLYNIVYWYTDFSDTYSERAEFMKNITVSKLLNKPVKGFALIVIIAPKEIKLKSLENFSLNVNKELKQIYK